MAQRIYNRPRRHRPPLLLLALIIAMAFLAIAAVSSASDGSHQVERARKSSEF